MTASTNEDIIVKVGIADFYGAHSLPKPFK